MTRRRLPGRINDSVGALDTPPITGQFVGAIGDSLAQGTPTSATKDTDAASVRSLFGESLFAHACWNSAGRMLPVRNAGIGGQSSGTILARIDGELAAYPEVGTWLLSMGANDALVTGEPLAVTQANITAAVQKIRRARRQVVLMTLPPVGSTHRAQYGKINAWLRYFAAKNGIPLADVNSVLTDPSTAGFLSGYDVGDGVHPTAAGMRACAPTVVAAFNSVLPYISSPLCTYNSDGQNCLVNGLFLTDAGADGTPDSWSILADATTYASSLATSTVGKGNAATLVATENGKFAQYTQNLPTSTFGIGDRLQIAGLVSDITSPQVNVYAVAFLASGSTTYRLMENTTTPGAGVTQHVHGIITVPPTTTGVTIRAQVFGNGTSVGAKFHQFTVRNLTRLEIAP